MKETVKHFHLEDKDKGALITNGFYPAYDLDFNHLYIPFVNHKL